MGSGVLQGDLWGERARDWADLHEHLHAPLYEAVFKAAGVDDRTRLLDIGCGSGVAAGMAVKRGAEVTGIDAAAAMIERARQRVPSARFIHGDFEEYPLGDVAFTLATSFNGVQFAADPRRALVRIARAVEPDGAVAVSTWGDPRDCEMRDLFAALASLLPPPPPRGGGPFALSTPGHLGELATSAGLQPRHEDEVLCVFEYPDLETAWRALSAAGPFVMTMRQAGEGPVRESIENALTPYRTHQGGVRLENTFRFVVARRCSAR